MNKKKLITVIAAALLVLIIAAVILLIAGRDGKDTDETTAQSESGIETPDESTDGEEETSANEASSPEESSAETTDEAADDPSEDTSAAEPSTVPETEPSTEPVSGSETTAPETEAPIVDGYLAIANGIQLVKLSSADVRFPEDGSGDEVKGVMAATFTNATTQTLQYAKFTVTCEGTDYTFDVTTLPAGASVIAFETSRKAAPDKIDGDVALTAVYTVYFETEPDKAESELEITAEDGVIKVKNVSSDTVSRNFSVFYKNMKNGVYFGGITYRVRISEDLAPGESVEGYASHASDGSVVMFVQYDS